MNDEFRVCPQCGRPFEKISSSGKIGFCPYHKMWYPSDDLGAQNEANEANRKYKEEELRKKQEKEELEKRKKKEEDARRVRSFVFKIVLVILAVAAAGAAVFWFRILPQQNYKDANTYFEQGEYLQALNGYKKLNGYEDSEEKILFCEALLSVQEESEEPLLNRYQRAFETILSQDDGEEGIDLLLEVIETMEFGMARMELRQFAVSVLDGDAERQQEQQEKYQNDLVKCLREWKTLNIEVQDVFLLMEYSQSEEISAEERKAIYREAALEAAAGANELSSYEFIEWNGDDKEELLVCSKEGKIEVYSYGTEFGCVWSGEMILPDASMEINDHYIFAVSGDLSAFGVWAYGDGKMNQIVGIDGIADYEKTENVIQYGISLEGSIERYIRYEYQLDTPERSPVATEIDWQQVFYPYPENAQETVRRYFEARSYGITEEADLLVGTQDYQVTGFSQEKAASMSLPENPTELEIQPYDTSENLVLFEVQYESGEKKEIIYAAVMNDNQWKIAGFAETFAAGMEEEKMNVEVPVLSLNAAVVDYIENKNDIKSYRLFVSAPSRVQMIWKAGEEEGSTDAFVVSLFDAKDMTESVISYHLKLSQSRQMSTPLFLSPGVYYLQVEAKKDVHCDYELTIQAEKNLYVEQESNNYAENANTIAVNQSYTGSLFEKEDVDCYAFSLEEAGAVNLIMEASAQDSKSVRYEVQLYNGKDGKKLTSCQMQGNVMTADTGRVYLGAGSYLIQVNRGSIWSSWDYQLTVEYEKSDVVEQENNNTPDTSTTISVNKAVTGSFGTEGDVDYFSFTLDGDMVIQPKLTFSPLESSSKTYVMTILNGMETLHSVKIGGKETGKVIAPLALKAGTYTLKLENPAFIHQDYTLTIAAVAADETEAESNNTLAQATDLFVNREITGVLTSEEDIDIYKVVLSEETIVTLSFEFSQSVSSGTAYVLKLENGGKTLWSTNISGESGGMNQKLQVPAGEYYLQVKPVKWCSAVYKIALSAA